jgi:hypothetical protein
MLVLISEITIVGSKTWKLNEVCSVNIVEDIKTLTDNCILTIPKKVHWQGTDFDNNLPIKRGDKIEVKLGYGNKLETRFTGYIRDVDNRFPVKITCEDSMFLLKSIKAKPKSYENAMLKDVIADLLTGTGIDFQLIDNIRLGQYRSNQGTITQELNEIREQFMLRAYFRTINDKPVLYVGLLYPFDNRKKEIFKTGFNIIEEKFEFKNKDDIRIKIEAKSLSRNNKKVYLEVGDSDGVVQKINIPDLTESELKEFALKSLEIIKKSGLRGSFTTFGQPSVTKCDIVEVHSLDGRIGTYLIAKNEIDFGMEGYRQQITLGQILELKESINDK